MAGTWGRSMRALSQRAAGPLDSDHPSVEVVTPCRSVATHTGFTKRRVSKVLVEIEKSQDMCKGGGEGHGLLLQVGGAGRKVGLTRPI